MKRGLKYISWINRVGDVSLRSISYAPSSFIFYLVCDSNGDFWLGTEKARFWKDREEFYMEGVFVFKEGR
eukprot:CAMPEP_0170488278 /NCGR_PEP_ID=MMETSP0208-20121228/6870_1 /TAXON_ID=197538 /ORGANISM="Strombidium inclinatum, Strain S3" /LENGTH=69 /DNA_ID=CAMNT_0010762805 /DNA_START=344 /DNA_END=549 /DNA_ORIENTATION=+